MLDFDLPDMTGLEFLSDAAAGGDLPCAVVLDTGQGNEAIAVEAMKLGARTIYVKDQVTAASLWRAITTAVTQTELRQRLARSLRDLTAANAVAGTGGRSSARPAEAELRAAKEAAEQANQAKTRFVAMVTHELRTPLNGILGYAQLLRIEGGLSPRQDARVGAMMQAGQHLLEMIERCWILPVSRPGGWSCTRRRFGCVTCANDASPSSARWPPSVRSVYAWSAPTTPRGRSSPIPRGFVRYCSTCWAMP